MQTLIWKTGDYAPSHDKLPKRPKKLADYPKSELHNGAFINVSRVIRNDDNYELREGDKVISTVVYKPWFIVELRNGYYAHLPIKRKSEALTYVCANYANQDWCAVYFDSEAIERVLVMRLKERVL